MCIPRSLLAVAAFLALLCTNARAEGPAPTEFVNIPWRSTLADARRIITQRPGVRLKEESPERLVLEGGMLADQPVERWELEFPRGEFRVGTVFLVDPSPGGKSTTHERITEFESLHTMLVSKYGRSRYEHGPHHITREWAWKVTDAYSGEHDAVSIVLRLDWSPTLFRVQYSNQPHINPDDTMLMPTPPKKSDL